MGPALRFAVAAVALLAVTGCNAGPEQAAGATRAKLAVAERDFHVSAPAETSAGPVRFVVHNAGPDTHELIVVRMHGAPLPLRRDGLTVDEDRLGSRIVATVEGVRPGSSHGVDLKLAPGRYELICNMTGHYLGGMRTELEVR